MLERFFRNGKKEEEKPQDMSRRKFLELGGKATAGALAGSVALEIGKKAAAAELSEEEIKKYYELENKILDILTNAEGGSKYILNRTIAENEQVRQAFIDNLSNEEIGEFLVLSDKKGRLEYAYAIFDDFNTQGLAVKYFNKYKTPEQIEKYTPFMMDRHYYFTRASDFLPKADEIRDFEIDPRLYRRKAAQEQGLLNDKEIIDATMEIEPGWSSENKQRNFKDILSNKSVRQALQASDCTLAEAYSVIKAAIEEQDRESSLIYVFGGRELAEPSQEDIAERVKVLLDEREKAKNITLLGPDTDNFIHFDFFEEGERQFDPGLMEDLAESSGVPPENVKTIDTNGQNPKGELGDRIAESRGNTTIYLNTHGNIDGSLEIKRGSNDQVHPGTIAIALIDRVLATRDPKDLSKVKLVFESCFSEDFLIKFINTLREKMIEHSVPEELGTDIDEIPFPDIITSSGRGSKIGRAHV